MIFVATLSQVSGSFSWKKTQLVSQESILLLFKIKAEIYLLLLIHQNTTSFPISTYMQILVNASQKGITRHAQEMK
jgi:hypothetical protein